MFIDMFKDVRSVVPAKVCVFAPERACAVEQFLSHDFNQNDAGWLRNDISALAAATTREQYMMILERMKELPASSNLPKGIKVKDAFDMIKPKNMQTENEFADFVGFLTEKGIKNAEAAYAAELAKKQVDKPVEKPAESSLE